MEKIFITGCCGYIGSHTCVELLNAGYEIIGLDNFSNSKPIVLDKIKKITGKDIKFYDARQDKFIQSNKAELNIIQDSSKLENNTQLYNVLDDNKLNLITSKTDDSIFLDFELNPNNKK